MTDNVVLVTGAAGFIGLHIAQRLLSAGREVVGLDSVNNYYDPRLKETRLEILKGQSNFTFVKLDLADRSATKSLFAQHRFPVVIHLAAQAGVRYSLENHQRAGGLPAQRLQASAFCILIIGLRRQYQIAVFGAG